ncbi:MAG: hypothetical protein JJE17_04220, partial [Peptostreptococcaceae bacterium]|nr:hypothetical protein [Peptostreptococcaceae bacterium]
SIAIGTAITLFVGRKVLKPISDFSHATTHVAKGDFNVRLNYNGRVDLQKEMVLDLLLLNVYLICVNMKLWLRVNQDWDRHLS